LNIRKRKEEEEEEERKRRKKRKAQKKKKKILAHCSPNFPVFLPEANVQRPKSI
jgi:hypothetical protein